MKNNILKVSILLIFLCISGEGFAEGQCRTLNAIWTLRGISLPYEGECKDGLAHGQGILRFKSGASYVGEWKSGNRDGSGTHTWANGDKYIGEFKNGYIEGIGTFTSLGGETTYIGTWKRDRFDGKGILRSDGHQYEGEFANSQMHGKGVLTLSNGIKHEGSWVQGDFRPKGISQADSQLMASGQWRDPATGLIWMRCPIGQKWVDSTCSGEPLANNWQESQDYIITMNKDGGFAGKTNWRVPTIEELVSIRKCTLGHWTQYGDKPTSEEKIKKQVELTKLPSEKQVSTSCEWVIDGKIFEMEVFDIFIFPYAVYSLNNSRYWSSDELIIEYSGAKRSIKVWSMGLRFGNLDGELKWVKDTNYTLAVRSP